MGKTIRLIAPDWQGGNKQEYYFGAELLAWLAPKNAQHKEITLDIEKPNNEELAMENGVVAQSIVKRNVRLAADILKEESPDKVITFGGSCLVSQAPFDYLHGKYGDELGVIWIDTHPDVSTPAIFHHEHAMVLGNLLGQGDPELAKIVESPFHPNSILYVGIQQPNEAEVALLEELKLAYTIQQTKRLTVEEIQQWIQRNGFSKLAIHLDLDVLDPNIFRSLYFSEPGVTEFPAASGKMTLTELLTITKSLSDKSEIVGLTIAEYLPWDAINLKNILAQLDIFGH